MLFSNPPPTPTALRAAIAADCLADETRTVEQLAGEAAVPADVRARVAARAADLVTRVRANCAGGGTLDAFLHEYTLSSDEGVVLMCLAEALLRIPDAETAERLIRDKIGPAQWEEHLAHSESVLVNASTWALMLTGRLVGLSEYRGQALRAVLGRLVARLGEPVVRRSVTAAMGIMGRQFVMGRTIAEALSRSRGDEARGYRHSYDMLGEAARTAADAERYYASYEAAIRAIGKASAGRGPLEGPGISVKLSALHPRYELAQGDRALPALSTRLATLAQHAREAGIGLTVDAEESARLEPMLDVFEAVSGDPGLAGWDGLGLAVQAYLKRAPAVIDWLADTARRHRRRIMVRLVKGAYWDSEIKLAQERGLDGYPVYTRKASTDVSYLACARRLLQHHDVFFPQFATHNAHALASVQEMAGENRAYEFQRLHGMGEALYDLVVAPEHSASACRVYAPVGSHEDLLAYLVRRLLENGANTSFVNRIVDEEAPVEALVADPVARVMALESKPHPRIPLPRDIYLPDRLNALGFDLTDPQTLASLAKDMDAAARETWTAASLVSGEAASGAGRPVLDPADRRRRVGDVSEAGPPAIDHALAAAAKAAPGWDEAGGDARADCLERAAGLMERDMPRLMTIAVREAGKTVEDALAEVREAADFCRYYAARCRTEFEVPEVLQGPTGERNELRLHGRGVFACISPWNFPLAIFTGQVAAALAAGNTVVAKPAEQTPLMAFAAVKLLHEAGIPPEVLHLLPGDGQVGAALVKDPRVAGVAFTGSTGTARGIQQTLAARGGPIVPLVAETGGQNALIVDSSALPEQVVRDSVVSAFRSAGQRCSALRVLFVQSPIADRVVEMLSGAMEELRIGDPALLATDVGPVIDDDARKMLEDHAGRMDREARLIHRCTLPADCAHGSFFAPRACEIDGIARLEGEVFGPVLHVVRYEASHLDAVVDALNATGYGLTLGIHSRIDATVEQIRRRARVGNTYVNRNQIGAVVGVQPFGGEGLSGTGPKAGGPRYLHRFATERTLSIDTTAQGGNASLVSLEE